MKKSLPYIIIGILIILLIIGGIVMYQERNMVVDMNLTPEVQEEYEQKLVEYTEKLKEPDETDALKRANIDHFIEKARYESYLGYLSKAEKTLLH